MKNVRMILIGCFLMMAACVKAQNISGKLVDEQNQPLAYANVVLQQTDSTFVKGETSDEKGSFRMTKVSAGDYRLVISSIGYETLYIDLQGFNRSTDLGTLTLKEDTKQLGEVTVTASNVSATADKKLVFPNEQQVKASANGVDLLRNLMIPRLNVNPMNNTVSTTDGGTVQLAINGRKATKEEVTALRPSEIIRVEMIEDPGLRYGESDAVVNYVVRRYEMGEVSGKLADFTIITSDNPRSEDPQLIISDVMTGIKTVDTQRIFVEADRGIAIKFLKTISSPEDVIVIAGKGHEDYQILKNETIHFDDREEAKKVFAEVI